MSRTRALVGRVFLVTLILSGLAAWAVLGAAYVLDASPLDNFDLAVHLSWVRGGPKDAANPAKVEGWPERR